MRLSSRRVLYGLTVASLAVMLMVPAGAASSSAGGPDPGQLLFWAPTGEIAFTSGPAKGGYPIYVVAPDGSGLRRLPAVLPDDFSAVHTSLDDGGTTSAAVHISPDGSTLLVDSANLYEVFLNGHRRRTVASGYDYGTWSPNGKQIAIYSNSEGGVWLMDADGSHRRLVATTIYDTGTGPTMSPDGKKIAYEACAAPDYSDGCEHGEQYGVYVIGVDGSDKHQVTRTREPYRCVSWSSAGKLAFETDDGTVAIVNKGGGLRTYKPGGCPIWAPGGRRFAVAIDRGVSLINSDGSGRRLARFGPTGSQAAGVAWSPNGRSLAVVLYDPNRSSPGQLWVVNSDGTGAKRIL